ncbi:MAG TPA: helix-turn-helix domain-containing protein [Streptosporangiaceae bacterium]
MADSESAKDDGLMAIPRLAEQSGVTPRVLRYWEGQGLISPSREHGRLRYSPRDVAIADLIRQLLAAGTGVDGIRMLKRLAERDIRTAATTGDQTALAETALRILYQRKAFREETGTDEEHYPHGKPSPPGPPHGPHPGPRPPGKPGTQLRRTGGDSSQRLRCLTRDPGQPGGRGPRRRAP